MVPVQRSDVRNTNASTSGQQKHHQLMMKSDMQIGLVTDSAWCAAYAD